MCAFLAIGNSNHDSIRWENRIRQSTSRRLTIGSLYECPGISGNHRRRLICLLNPRDSVPNDALEVAGVWAGSSVDFAAFEGCQYVGSFSLYFGELTRILDTTHSLSASSAPCGLLRRFRPLGVRGCCKTARACFRRERGFPCR